jgi:alkanesulfonate monooxygenase SsuD/methylene tetrahydromethanopterin reductase-like flavin-dependent oxidoreductase (luciferase family)
VERGLFYQLGPLTPARFDALAREVALAESLGLARVWCLPTTAEAGGWGGSAPEVWIAGLAGRTHSIRLGWGVPGIWPPTEPPVREAEQGATLDGACGGRLDLAVLPEVGAHAASDDRRADGADGADDADDEDGDDGEHAASGPRADAMGSADEGIRMWVDMWAPATFSWTSARFSVPPIDVVPKPVQRPHPPLWLVGWTGAHAFEAGRAGMGYLDVSGGGYEVWEASRACHAAGRAEAPVDALVCEEAYAVAADPPEDWSAVGREARSARDFIGGLEAIGIDRVLLRADPLDGGHEETCRRIRWFAEQPA